MSVLRVALPRGMWGEVYALCDRDVVFVRVHLGTEHVSVDLDERAVAEADDPDALLAGHAQAAAERLLRRVDGAVEDRT